MATQPDPRISEKEYLKLERQGELRHEYVDGQMFAMAGASRYHGRIVSNLHYQIRRALSASCNIYTSDMRVNVSVGGLYTYPAVVVTCGEERFLDEQVDTLLNPVLLIEVFSPSTQDYDRGSKFEAYRRLASLQEYLTVAQDRVHVQQCRSAGSGWTLEYHNDYSSIVLLNSIGVSLPVSAIYEKVNFSGEMVGAV